MRNIDNLKTLSEREMAWFLMAYSDPCRTCIYKKFHAEEGHRGKFLNLCSCMNIPEDEKMTCLDATQAWLERETIDEDDVFMFDASRNNVKIEERNAKIERHNAEVWEKMGYQNEMDGEEGE